ncbi:terminase, large subunit [Clostridium neonatale]|uniref:phage terminase large subunit family protein n=1 Tax=Clostridium neonatale TaxID=137838 RepID=UPI00291C16A0|nr:phage terminase large subunit family protein [Clostridium neonatale]CAI3579049.1 terminase, large subunit [Clostridium neonatale]CAI3644742.1 terminase, large subunit [Clostridium neonatale]CAI3647183.1 terminase, large subunit [Clostridium neonatale]CAI3660225.1 terminase, large subunit [Clostridium neonatale]CAI3718723.1 terminase, large subunit [Clostridium neonatale]
MHLNNLASTEYTKQIKNNQWSDWIRTSLKVLKPPERLKVSEWANKYRVLDSKTSAEPGRWQTMRTPYLQGIMDSFNDVDVEEIIFVKPTQVGGTESLNNMLGYVIMQDPSPTLIVYPTLDLAKYTSKNRLKPMIQLSDVLNKRFFEPESNVLELQFDGMYLVLSGANSPASLASRPIRFLFMDEIDKYPSNSGREADPRALARERTKTYVSNKKIFEASTPTLKNGPIWTDWENADCQKKYYVPCPHCGNYQLFKFKNLKWKEHSTAEEASNTAYYECEECRGMITDNHKPEMLRNGEWRSIKESGCKRTAFHINAIYSPWVRFGDVAKEFVKSKDYPDLLMNFINSWLAEPWEQTEVKMDSDVVLKRESEYEEATVPDGTLLLTAGVDVQKHYFYYTIRAWGTGMTSWNVTHGMAETWDQIEYIMNLPYYDLNGKAFQVNLACIDSGDQTDDVYEFCVINQDWAVPVKGSSSPLLSRYRASVIDKVGSKATGMILYIVDGAQYKDMISARIQRPNGSGSWMVYKGCDRDYAEQIVSEEKVIERKNGRNISVWKTKTSHADNHYLDCEVYAAAAADLLHVRYLQPEERIQELPKKEIIENDYLKASENWLNTNGEWLK